MLTPLRPGIPFVDIIIAVGEIFALIVIVSSIVVVVVVVVIIVLPHLIVVLGHQVRWS